MTDLTFETRMKEKLQGLSDLAGEIALLTNEAALPDASTEGAKEHLFLLSRSIEHLEDSHGRLYAILR